MVSVSALFLWMVSVLNCSKLGTAIWNQETGGCECKQHITFGTLCDSCLSGTYIHPQQGCVQCDWCPVTLGGNGTCIYGIRLI